MTNLESYITSRIRELQIQINNNEEAITEMRSAGQEGSSLYELRIQRRGILHARKDELEFLLCGLTSGQIYK